ncbi:MAG: hypothetical protein ACD_75C02252G0003 [uncultured bacterium]|nr:MAG: hypothetical protein ACD_75C02252G0003 [uncultured bacterium]
MAVLVMIPPVLCALFVHFGLYCFINIEALHHFSCNFSMLFANKFDTTL